MSLDKAEITRLAALAQLRVAPEEVDSLVTELGKILDFVEQMRTGELAEVTPMAHPLELSARLRPDVVTKENRREQYQTEAPSVSDGFYLVPKVIE